MGRNNGAARVVGFMDFGDKEERGVGIGDMEERYILNRNTMDGASTLKEG